LGLSLRTVESVEGDLKKVRKETLELVEMIPEDFLFNPPKPYMGPIIWDLVHIGKFEELWILHNSGGNKIDEFYRNDSYNAIITPRKNRLKLDLPSISDSLKYLKSIRDRVLDYLNKVDLNSTNELLKNGYVFDLVIQHECQHQETILQSLALYHSPPFISPDSTSVNGTTFAEKMVKVPSGKFQLGSNLGRFIYDNEQNSSEIFLNEFLIDSYPVSCGSFIQFIENDGYMNKEYWSEEGWKWKLKEDVNAPLYWEKVDGEWKRRSYHQTTRVFDSEPVVHVSYWEAEAYANHKGKRLPTEFEWEKACRWNPETGETLSYPWGEEEPNHNNANIGKSRWSPAPVGSYKDSVSPAGCHQMIGDVYEWTSSDFLPYNEFKAFPYEEYSEVHFGTEYKVLRGSSWATSHLVARSTFRNWEFPQRRHIFAGFRCAMDAEKG